MNEWTRCDITGPFPYNGDRQDHRYVIAITRSGTPLALFWSAIDNCWYFPSGKELNKYASPIILWMDIPDYQELIDRMLN
jgi:hypothetical protein